MKFTLLSDESLRLEPTEGPMTIEAIEPGQQYSPFHMLASSLAVCVFSVLASWAEHAKIDATRLALQVDWRFAEKPHRVGEMVRTWRAWSPPGGSVWPELPPERRTAAERAAHLCAIHNTLANGPTVTSEIAS